LNKTLIVGVAVLLVLVICGLFGGGANFIWYCGLPLVVIVGGGSVAATLATTPLSEVKNFKKWLKIAFVPPKYDPRGVIDEIEEYAVVACGKGLLRLEESADKAKNPFMKQALTLIVDATDSDKTRELLEDAQACIAERHQAGAAVFGKLVSLAPCFGLIGTLIGLAKLPPMFAGDWGSVAIAVAVTFYGALLANAVFAPIVSALTATHKNEDFCLTLIVEGVVSITNGGTPKMIRENLEMMLTQSKIV
jgi:chemotaxis protein MotA